MVQASPCEHPAMCALNVSRDPHQWHDVLLHRAGAELGGRAVADDAEQRSGEAAVVAQHHLPGSAGARVANVRVCTFASLC